MAEAENLETAIHDPVSFDLNSIGDDGGQELEEDQDDGGESPAGEEAGDDPSSAQEPQDEPGEEQDTSGEDEPDKGDDPAQDEPAAKAEQDDSNSVVLTRDGKNQIPYGVLESARTHAKEQSERNAQLEKQLAEQQAALQAALAKAGHPQQTDDSKQEDDPILDPDLEKVLEDEGAGALAKSFKKMAARVESLQAQVKQSEEKVEQANEQVQRERVGAWQREVEAAFSNSPKGEVIRSDPGMFANFLKVDETLRKNPDFANMSASERLDKNIATYEAWYEPVKLPAGAGEVDKQTDSKPKKDAEPEGLAPPGSLSDLPGGERTTESSGKRLSDSDPMAMAEMFMAMTPEKLDETLAGMP